MEQVFNPKRFIKYAVYQFSNNKKTTLLILAGFCIALFLFIFTLVANQGIHNENEWMGTFWGTSIVAALLLLGHSFPALRNKKTSANFLTTPVSLFEKFTFEILVKMVLFAVLYPIIFKLIGEMAVAFADYIFPLESHSEFTYNGLIQFSKEEFFPIIPCLYIFGASLAFAGSTAFKKMPLVKTAIFLGAISSIVISYFYLIIEKWKLGKPIGEFFENSIIADQKDAITTGIIVLIISTVTALLYSFYNIKEREV